MAHRELQVTVISAQDLKNVRLSGRTMSPYAEVGIRGKPVQTGVHSGGGINPSWNYVVTLPCVEEDLFRTGGAVTIALRHRGSFCHKLIGTATVPLSDLSLQCRAADSNASRESTLMSYQVRVRSGKPHGVLNISVMVGALVKQAGYGRLPSVGFPSETAPPVTTYTPPPPTYFNPQQQQQVYPPPLHNAYSAASQQNFYPTQHAQHNYQQAAY